MDVELLRKDMVAAMKAKDKPKKEAISSLISAIKKTAIDEGCRDNIPEEMADRVILKELKTVKEQIFWQNISSVITSLQNMHQNFCQQKK